jgi:hypothetical protein
MIPWVRLHWFEVSALLLLVLNLWFISSVLGAIRETNTWLALLARYLDERARSTEGQDLPRQPSADC